MAGGRKDGRFNSGPQRNQARFVKNAAEAFEGDNAHERDCVLQLRFRMMRISFLRSLERYS